MKRENNLAMLIPTNGGERSSAQRNSFAHGAYVEKKKTLLTAFPTVRDCEGLAP